MLAEKRDPKPHHILVAVITTAGTFPDQGFDEVPENQPVKVELEHAARKLGITNTNGWIATVGGRELNVAQDYVANSLKGTVEINWGPREGGGGCRS
jgi:hypothetical protein